MTESILVHPVIFLSRFNKGHKEQGQHYIINYESQCRVVKCVGILCVCRVRGGCVEMYKSWGSEHARLGGSGRTVVREASVRAGRTRTNWMLLTLLRQGK